ncbi:hypothetical protein IWQ61_000816 [Dispira simplex]|nr:hypothetical protein IWQ61_000816 [Dispira simplex]
MRLHSTLALYAVAWSSALVWAREDPGRDHAQSLLEKAQEHVAAKDYTAAYDTFQEALKADPDNYMTYFYRATAYLRERRTTAALVDLDQALKHKPDFEPALRQRAKLLNKRGAFEAAKADWEALEALGGQAQETAQQGLDKVTQAERAYQQARKARDDQNYAECVQFATAALKTASEKVDLYQLRGDCQRSAKDIHQAVADYGRAIRLDPTQLDIQLQVAQLRFYVLNQHDEALSAVKECLRSDPEHKPCSKAFKRFKKIKKAVKEVETDAGKKKFNSAAKKLTAFHQTAQTSDSAPPQGLIQELEEETVTLYRDWDLGDPQLGGADTTEEATGTAVVPELVVDLYHKACQYFAGFKKHQHGIEWCSKALRLDPNNVESLLARADLYLLKEEGDQAVVDLNKAQELSGSRNSKIREKLMKAMQLQRKAKRKDYYKILELSKEATPADIKRAFRKMAKVWHPDRYRGDLSEEEVHQKMSDINEAHEILSDPERRAQYDQGHDPNDPSGGFPGGGGGGGFNPFASGGGQQFFFQGGGGFPFEGFGGGQGGRFKFQFM